MDEDATHWQRNCKCPRGIQRAEAEGKDPNERKRMNTFKNKFPPKFK